MSFPRYPKYKDSGVEWLGEVPEHWDVLRLKYACQVFPSNVDKKTYENDPAVRLCNYTDVYYNDRITADMDLMTATATPDQIAKFTLRAGDTIITKDSETADDIAVAAYVPHDMPGVVCGYHLSMVRPLNGTDGAFVKRLFDSTYARSCFAVRANGLTRVGLGQHELDSVEMPFPPTAEQTAIAAFLDRETAKIDGLVGEQRRLIELLKEKRQAVISHAVTKGLNPHAPMKPSGIEWLGDVPEHWEVKRLKFLGDPFIGLTYDPSEIVEEGQGTLVLRSSNVQEGRIVFDDNVYVAKTIPERLVTKIGDILICSRNGSRALIGKNAMIDARSAGLTFGAFMTVLRSSRSEYLFYVFNSPLFEFQSGAFLTSTINQLTVDTLNNFEVPMPPPVEQAEIVVRLKSETARLDTLTAEAERAIDLLQERRTALISAAVTGKIDVRGEATLVLPTKKPYTSGFARQLLAAEILHCCHAHPTTGRVKLQKLIHLCEHVAEIEEVNASYDRKAAGPFDNKVMFGIASALAKQQWFAEVKDGQRSVYRPLEKAGEHRKYLARWASKLPLIDKVLHLLGEATTQQCEIVSTLYAAWNDLLIDGKSPSDAEIIHEASDAERWHQNKENIPTEKWPVALEWMRMNSLVPRGFGNHTKRSAGDGHDNSGAA